MLPLAALGAAGASAAALLWALAAVPQGPATGVDLRIAKPQSAPGASESVDLSASQPVQGFSLLQLNGGSSGGMAGKPREKNRKAVKDASPTCAPLKNYGSHFTVDIDVGTPGQKFSVVADTGSDAVVIPSCVCRDQGSCAEEARCFRGTNRSSTFLLSHAPHSGDDKEAKHDKEGKVDPIMVSVVFGSGALEAVIASDVVKVGGLKAAVKSGLLLMVNNQLMLPNASSFEGILGLGPPKNKTKLMEEQKKMDKKLEEQEKKMKEAMKAAPAGDKHGHGGSGSMPIRISPGHGGAMQGAMGDAIKKLLKGIMGGQGGKGDDKKESGYLSVDGPPSQLPLWQEGFLQSAGVSRFSLCFRDRGKDGALRLQPPMGKGLKSIGQHHWGVDFQGVSVGDAKADVQFCSPHAKTKGQKTACAAIPDTGTTLLMAPASHLETLFGQLCDEWPRCAAAAKTGLEKKKLELFMLLLGQCGEWKSKEHGLDELPAIHLHLAGAGGAKQSLKLDGNAYIIETEEDELEIVTKHLMGMPMKVRVPSGKKRKVCAPAFGGHEMNTTENGPVWILGSPIFYEYEVGYALSQEEPAISFTKAENCGCEADAKRSSEALMQGARVRQPRELHVPPRLPSIDLSAGL